jgi:large subunit ribosomal protein L23
MWFISAGLLSPPKMPRNIFFPWQNFILHQSGSYLEPNRVAFRVPVNMTKLDIREYLRRLYGVKVIRVNTFIKLPKSKMCANRNYFKTDASYKKAIVTCEETVPDEVKMIHSCRDLRLNPAVTKGMLDPKVNKGNSARPGQSRSNDWKPRHEFAWREPIPLLLGEATRPGLAVNEAEIAVNKKFPFSHFNQNSREIPVGVPKQKFPGINSKKIIESRRPGGKFKSLISQKLQNLNLIK